MQLCAILKKKSRRCVLLCAMCLGTSGWLSVSSAHEGQDHGMLSTNDDSQTAFVAENAAAMEKMMTGMNARPTGDVDQDFVTSMSAHHQGAIDMAVTMLKYGHNEQLKRMAQEIIIDQQQEIAAMQQAIGKPLPPSRASPTQVSVVTP
jgi:uncharacterized protein (DUF305 family)